MRVANLSYQGVEVHLDHKMVNLTDMWRAAGSPDHKDPPQWLRHSTTSDLIEVLALNMSKKHVLRSTRGRVGATWAIANLAIAYAKYLSPEFQVVGHFEI